MRRSARGTRGTEEALMLKPDSRQDSPPAAMTGPRAHPRAAASPTGLTWRALLVGALCVVLVCLVCSWSELVNQQELGTLQFPPGAFGVFVLLLLGNCVIRRVRQQWALRPGELAVCYVMMVISAVTASRGAPRRLIPLLTSINYDATPVNRWQETFFAHLPRWLVPWNPDAGPMQPLVRGLYEGLHDGEPIPWQPWIAPLARWSVVLMLVFGAFLFLSTLLRRQWTDHERLSFPLAQIPTELLRAETDRPLHRNGLLYLGAALPVLVHSINLWHNINANVPQLQLSYLLCGVNSRLAVAPFNQMLDLWLRFSFAAFGFFLLLPTDVLFSFWFSYLVFAKGHEIVLLSLGQTLDHAPYADTTTYLVSAETGGFLVLAAYLLYLARPAVLAALRGDAGSQGEMVRYRTALIGLVITLLGAALWYRLAGLSLWLGLMEFLVYVLVIAVVMTRATTEGGLLMTEIIFTPLDAYGIFGRRQLLGARDLTMTVFATVPFAGDMRGLTLEGIMDSQKIADSVGLRRRSLFWALWLAFGLSLAAGYSIQLWINYRQGALGLHNQFIWLSEAFFRQHQAFLDGEERTSLWAPTSFLLGAAFTLLLSYLRLQFYWWPLNPIGFVMCGSWSMMVYWFPMLVAWAVKTLLLRYGGMKTYQRARPLFFGLVLGEMTIAVVFTAVSAIWRVPPPFIPFD
jgi:hypothetical protein